MAEDEIEDAEWEEIPGSSSKVQVCKAPQPAEENIDAANCDAGSKNAEKSSITSRRTFNAWWAAQKWLAHVDLVLLLIAFFIFLGFALRHFGVGTGDDQHVATDKVGQSHMSRLAEFVLGDEQLTGFAATDGDGHPGEFCTASKGEILFRFGKPPLPDAGDSPNFFAMTRVASDDAVVGLFRFDDGGDIFAYNLQMVHRQSPARDPMPDLQFKVARSDPDMIELNGRKMHFCIF